MLLLSYSHRNDPHTTALWAVFSKTILRKGKEGPTRRTHASLRSDVVGHDLWRVNYGTWLGNGKTSYWSLEKR